MKIQKPSLNQNKLSCFERELKAHHIFKQNFHNTVLFWLRLMVGNLIRRYGVQRKIVNVQLVQDSFQEVRVRTAYLLFSRQKQQDVLSRNLFLV